MVDFLIKEFDKELVEDVKKCDQEFALRSSESMVDTKIIILKVNSIFKSVIEIKKKVRP